MSDIAEKIAADMKGWWKLTCLTCASTQNITKGQFALYLRSGWPECCGSTMTLSKRREAAR